MYFFGLPRFYFWLFPKKIKTRASHNNGRRARFAARQSNEYQPRGWMPRTRVVRSKRVSRGDKRGRSSKCLWILLTALCLSSPSERSPNGFWNRSHIEN
jgi:hypothetical protein